MDVFIKGCLHGALSYPETVSTWQQRRDDNDNDDGDDNDENDVDDDEDDNDNDNDHSDKSDLMTACTIFVYSRPVLQLKLGRERRSEEKGGGRGI